MKKTIAPLAIILAIFSVLYFTGTAVAGKGAITSATLGSVTGSDKSNMTFNYTINSGTRDANSHLQVSSQSDFSTIEVDLKLTGDSQTPNVNCSSLPSGPTQVYWRVTQSGVDVSGQASIQLP